MDTKICTKCGELKDLSSFYNHSTKDGKRNDCKDCRKKEAKDRYATTPWVREWLSDHSKKQSTKDARRARDRQSKYGVTPDILARMLTEQEGLCAICLDPVPEGKTTRHIDHSHTTGKVRGILCHLCNVGLGNARDRIDVLQAMIDYLKKHAA